VQELIDRIKSEGVHVGGGIVKVDSFLNHQVDPKLMTAMGQAFAERLVTDAADDTAHNITRVITAEVSGIAPALATANVLDVPLVYARKQRSSVMTDDYHVATATSRTKKEDVCLMISRRYLGADDRVLVIDDFLATGSTMMALVELIKSSGAAISGIGCVIEKPAEGGRSKLDALGIPVVSLACVDLVDDAVIVR